MFGRDTMNQIREGSGDNDETPHRLLRKYSYLIKVPAHLPTLLASVILNVSTVTTVKATMIMVFRKSDPVQQDLQTELL